MDKRNNNPVVSVSFQKLKLNCKLSEKYLFEVYQTTHIFKIRLKRSLKKIAAKKISEKILQLTLLVVGGLARMGRGRVCVGV